MKQKEITGAFKKGVLIYSFLLLLLFFLLSFHALASPAPKIISLAPDLTEMVYALSLEDVLVAVSEYSDFPPQAKKLPIVGSFISPNIEKILFLHPSTVLAREGATPAELLQTLQKNKIEVLSFPAQTEKDIYATLFTIGKKFNKAEKARSLIKNMKENLAHIQKHTSDFQKPRVLIQIEEVHLMVAGKNTLPHRAIELSGGLNITSSYQGYPKLQREVLLKLNPDIIIIPETSGQEEKVKRMKALWKGKRIYIISGDLLTRATPRFIEGVTALSKKIHEP